jgi:murein L,D-transpeptidase YcbB/YkuD
MKKTLFISICIQALLFASAPDARLVSYQKRYSLCNGKTDIQISQCLLNGNLNYAGLRGDTYAYRNINKSEIEKAFRNGNIYDFTMDHLPKTKRYNELKKYLDHLYSIRQEYIPPIFKGDDAEDITRIKRVFNLLKISKLKENSEYTSKFEAALLEYQRRFGLEVDGKIGPDTKRHLKIPISAIITKTKKNLVWESISTPKGSNYILVNIPEFRMHYYDHGEPVLDMKIVVGKTRMRTPVFNQTMKYIVKNPRWNVPPSIYAKEYAHKSEEYLIKEGFAYNSEGKLYQKEGPDNALGLVKFLFPNRYNVYMHDTPAKSLFNRRIRTFSHGCIRLEKPLELLNQLGYEYDTDKNKWVALERQIPVYVEYHTVWVDDDGKVQFRDDIYGYERKLFN